MRHYDPAVVRHAIEQVLAPDWQPPPHEMEGYSRVDKLMDMFSAMTEACYSVGRLEVQTGVVDALGLHHLLGR